MVGWGGGQIYGRLCHWVTGDAYQFPAVRASVSVVTLSGRCTPTADSTSYYLHQPTSTAVTQRSAAQIETLDVFVTLNDFPQFVQLNNGLQAKRTLRANDVGV